jgi:hypothetical protein
MAVLRGTESLFIPSVSMMTTRVAFILPVLDKWDIVRMLAIFNGV